MKHILVICIGNICRSPLAEGLLKKELPHHVVFSAGLSALVGQSADPLSVKIAAEHGFNIQEHRAQQVAAWMCQQADLILVMERGHKDQLQKIFPWARGKIFCLNEKDIDDPYCQSRSYFDTAYSEISNGVFDWVSKVKKLA